MESREYDWIHAKPVFIVTRYRYVHIYITTARDCIVGVAGEIVSSNRYALGRMEYHHQAGKSTEYRVGSTEEHGNRYRRTRILA